VLGTGELRQYDVPDPMQPKLVGSLRLGGIVNRAAHPNGRPFRGGPQMVEISRDGERVYFTNSLYSTWDDQFYPGGMPGVMVMANAKPEGGMELDRKFWGLEASFGQHPWAWLAIVGLGAYHGLNPAMGWLFAVSTGMQEKRARGIILALPPIAAGHLLAMAAALLPFTLLGLYVERLTGIRIAAGLMLVTFGLSKLVRRRHPRFLARVGPSDLTLWSFPMATAHGAGLMLVPLVLELGGDATEMHAHHHGLFEVARGSLVLMFAAATVHSAAMVPTGGGMAWLVYRYVGLGPLHRSWINLDLLWAVLLILVGAIAIATTLWDKP
jgi:56kDa selenium binding protein (SBP56)